MRLNENKQRYKAYMHTFGITNLFIRNPVVVALWAAIFPGMGHILLNKHLIGFALFVWEIVINFLSHLNEAIYYSFIGQFQAAKEILDIRWLLLYCPMYVFAIWDSYRTTVNLNKEFMLACNEDNMPIKTLVMSPLSINTLEKKLPWQAAFWSLLTPGAGQLINHQIFIGFLFITFWGLSLYLSRLLPAIHYTMLGMFESAKQIVNIHWLLNIPSIYCFSIYNAYTNAIEVNKLYEWEQADYFRKEYTGSAVQFKFPI